MRKTKAALLSIVLTFSSFSALTLLGSLPVTSAQEVWEEIQSIQKTINIPPGESYFAYFDRDSGSLVGMELLSLEAGLTQNAVNALDQVPEWLYEDLAKQFGRLGDTNIDVGDFATPTFADMDADGDLDLSLGSEEGNLSYYENVGTQYKPIFVEDKEMYSYICEEYLNAQDRTSLDIADLDADGDYDLLVGNSLGTLFYLENIGTPLQPEWGPCEVVDNIIVGNSHPALTDLNDDGDLDLALGTSDGKIYFYENEGSPESANWVFSYYVDTGEEDDRPVCFGDIDDDGDYDLTVGDGDFATLYYYRNIGNSEQEVWTADATMYNGIVPEYGTSPTIADLNGDQRPDLIVGGSSGRSFYYSNIGTASNAEWLIWSSYQVGEGYMYYPKDVFLSYMNKYHMDRYANLILNAAQKYKDEIGFAIAHVPIENLKSMNDNQIQLFVDNARLIYEIDQYLDYVEVIEKEDYTTTRYKFGEPGNTVDRELPRDIYYWFIVHPKITDENVYYIHPDDSDSNHPTDPADGGKFWRDYFFYHADEAYPLDNSGAPDDGVDDYPVPGVQPPLLKDLLEGVEVLFNGTTWHAPGGNYSSFQYTGEDNIRPFDYGDHAVIRVSNWVGKTLIINQQEVSDSERPIQPVRIAHHHNGNCGELQDLTTAAARTALIPAAGVLLLGEDHVWIEFYENGWHQWDNYWSDGGSVIDNWNNYWGGWGQRGGSGIFKHGGDDDTWEVTDHYIPDEDLNYVTIKVMDNNGDPVDGARVLVISYWLKVTISGYQVEIPFPCIWNYTDANGETLFKLATQTKDGGNKNFTFRIISKVGSTESGKIEFEHGQDYTFSFYLEGSAPNPSLNTNQQTNPNPPDPEFKLGVSYQVKAGTQHPRNLLTGNYHPEEIPPERLPDVTADDFSGIHVDSFVTTKQGFFEFIKGYTFDSYELKEESNSNAFEFDIPEEEEWYFVISNLDSIETTMVVELTLDVYYDAPPYSVKITDPYNGSLLNIGGIISVEGIVTNDNDLTSLKLSTDNGNSWATLSWIGNHWSYAWDTGSLSSGAYRIEVVATYESSQDSDSIDIKLLDLEPPSVNILTPYEYSKINIGSTVTISGNAADNFDIVSLQLSTDGRNNWVDILLNLQDGMWSYNWITTGLPPGYYVIQIYASDGTNHKLASSWERVELLDMEPPSVYILNPTDDSKINIGTMVTITGNAMDNIELVDLRLSMDGGENWIDVLPSLEDDVWSSQWDTTGVQLGKRTLIVNASDGKHFAIHSVDVELTDSEGPSISITFPQEGSQVNICDIITISGNAIDNVGIQELQIRLGGGGNGIDILGIDILPSLKNDRWSYDWNTEGLALGTYTIQVEAFDGVNQEIEYIEFELADLESPEVNISYPKDDHEFNCGEVITITGTASDNFGIAELRISTDGGLTWADILPSLDKHNWSYNWDTEGLIGDRYIILVEVSDIMDQLGSDTAEINLIDTEKPLLKITSPDRDSEFNVGDFITIKGTASDNARIMELRISTDEDGTWISILPSLVNGQWQYIWDTTGLEPGMYRIRIKVSDGTYEAEDTVTVVLVSLVKEEGRVGISPMLILLLTLIVTAIISASVLGLIIFKRGKKGKEVVVFEEK